MKTTTPTITAVRYKAIRAAMKTDNLDAYIVHHLPTIRYLTNFSGSNALLVVTQRSVLFFTDDRYAEQIKTELYQVDGLKAYIERDIWKFIADKKLLKGAVNVGFESNVVSVDSAKAMRKALPGVKLKAAPGLARKTTMPKSAEEVAYIKKAADITAKVYEYVLGFVKPGMREIDVAAEITYQGRKLSSEGDAFEIIFVSGIHGAFVHGRASHKKIRKGEVITLDFGCRVNGFHSDQTRTFSLGKPSREALKAWSVVTEAHARAIDAIKPNINCAELDLVARNIITNAGYGDYYKHSLGHGLGIEVHEAPAISHRNTTGVVPEGCVITIEPGIYIPDNFGMRLEDDMHVTSNGPVYLTSSPREMIMV